MQWSQCQVLVEVGKEHSSMIFFTYKFHILENSIPFLPELSEPLRLVMVLIVMAVMGKMLDREPEGSELVVKSCKL